MLAISGETSSACEYPGNSRSEGVGRRQRVALHLEERAHRGRLVVGDDLGPSEIVEPVGERSAGTVGEDVAEARPQQLEGFGVHRCRPLLLSRQAEHALADERALDLL